MSRSAPCFLTFLLCCIICASYACTPKPRSQNCQKTNPSVKHASMRFSSLDSFSCSNTSALTISHNYKLNDVSKNQQISKWIANIVYPPKIFISENGYRFLLSSSRKPTGLDTNFYHWLILAKDGHVVDDIVSLSRNINNCYLKKGEMHFAVYDYDDEFFYNKQSELIPIAEIDFVIKDSLIFNNERKFYVKE